MVLIDFFGWFSLVLIGLLIGFFWWFWVVLIGYLGDFGLF